MTVSFQRNKDGHDWERFRRITNAEPGKFRLLCHVHLPVVPAGVISLKYLTTSSRSERFASVARQRIHFVVSGPGSLRETWLS